MPWDNVPKDKWPAMERCVKDLVDNKGKTEKSANAICYSSIMGKASMLELLAATEEDVLAFQADVPVLASLATNSILKFSGACLARAETNLNGDGITDEGIQQLASTIRLMPITEEHEKEPRGIFTKGYTNDDSTECLVDGFIWAGHFPKFAEEVQDGTRKLSMDAEAKLAVCNICGAVFTNTGEYCDHIRHRSNGAVRWLYDLTAVAGGAVKYPAGTGTVFPGKEGFVVVSHLEVQNEWWRKYWKTEGDIPTSKFADKKNRKYPFLDPDGSVDHEGWMAAWKYAHAHSANSVIAVLKKHLPKGYKLEGDSVVKGGKVMKVVCAECGHEHEFETDAERLQAELDAKLKELQDAQAKVETVEKESATTKAELEAEKRVTDRFAELAKVAGIEVAQGALGSLRKVDDEVFETLKTMASRKPEAPKAPETVIAAERETQVVTADTWEYAEK